MYNLLALTFSRECKRSAKKQGTKQSFNVHRRIARGHNEQHFIATVFALCRQRLHRYLRHRYFGFWVRQCIVSCHILFLLHATTTTYPDTLLSFPLKYNRHLNLNQADLIKDESS